MNTLRGVFPDPPQIPRRNFIRENMIHIKRMQGMSDVNSEDNRRNRPVVVEAEIPHQQTLKLIQSTKRQLQEYQRQSALASIKPTKIKTSLSDRNVPNKKNVPKHKSRHGQKNIFNTSKTAVESLNETLHRLKFKETGMQTENYRNVNQLYEQGTIVYPSENVITVLTHKKTSPRPKTDEVRSPKYYGDGDISNRSPELKPVMEGDKRHDFVKENAQVVKNANGRLNQSTDPNMAPSTYQKGVIPKYLRERKEELHKSKGDGDVRCPVGHVVLPENERKETLRMLRQSYAELINELNSLPVRSDTLKIRTRKIEIENQLKKLDEGIKVFTRPTVYVKIGA